MAEDVAVQSDGKLVIAGSASFSGSGRNFVLLRLLPNGNLDSTFGTSGQVVTDFAGALDFVAAVAIQGDGKIVAGGLAQTGAEYDFAVVRYLPNGSLDPTFGTGGKVTTDFGTTSDQIRSLAIAPTGGSSLPEAPIAAWRWPVTTSMAHSIPPLVLVEK